MTGPYRRWIADYRDSGLHPFPVDGKRPCVRAYAARRPSLTALERWSSAFPDANLGLPTRREGLVVLDADDPAAVALFEEIAGYTPLRVLTRRGEHWYYSDPTGLIASAIHPSGQPFDIRAAGKADYVLVPGSEHGGATYRLADQACVAIPEFARRLKSLPPLEHEQLRHLLQQPRGYFQPRLAARCAGAPVILTGAPIEVGARNDRLFRAACRDAHDVRRRSGDTDDGLNELLGRVEGYNDALCTEPLPSAEVEKLTRSAWARTLSGVNRPPSRHRRHIRDALCRIGREVRALMLWGWLSQSNLETDDMDLAPARVAKAIPGWKPHDADAAIKRLVGAKVLRILHSGEKGRGRAARYRLTELLVSDVAIATAFHRLEGDAAALTLLVFLVDVWGDAGTAPISAEGMSQHVGGPFGAWTKVRIVKARDHLAEAGLIKRLPVKRTGVRHPRATFQVRAADVLKMPGNVPVDIHRPRSGEDVSGRGVSGADKHRESLRMVANTSKPVV
jgi:hypothetical protein